MAKIKFIHTADLHLDSPFKSLSSANTELAKKLKDASLEAFQEIISLAISEKVDFVVIAGDIFDGEDKSLTAQLAFRDELEKLASAEISVYFNCGNHDPLSSWMKQLSFPEIVHRFDSEKMESLVYEKDGQPLAEICGISFEEKVVKENLAIRFERQSPELPISVAVLHGTVGNAGPHERYAPFTVEDVADKGFDYWALGHIHQKEIIREADPAIVYPGIPQGRDMGESGAKGCYLVELEKGQAPKLEFLPTDKYRFEHLEIDLSGTETIDQIPARIDEAKEALNGYQPEVSYLLRVTLKGRTVLHQLLHRADGLQQLQEYCNDGQLQQDRFTWIDKFYIKTQPNINLEQVAKGETFAADLLKAFDELDSEKKRQEDMLGKLSGEFASYQVRKEFDTDLTDEEREEIVAAAKWKLMDQLLKEE